MQVPSPGPREERESRRGRDFLCLCLVLCVFTYVYTRSRFAFLSSPALAGLVWMQTTSERNHLSYAHSLAHDLESEYTQMHVHTLKTWPTFCKCWTTFSPSAFLRFLEVTFFSSIFFLVLWAQLQPLPPVLRLWAISIAADYLHCGGAGSFLVVRRGLLMMWGYTFWESGYVQHV